MSTLLHIDRRRRREKAVLRDVVFVEADDVEPGPSAARDEHPADGDLGPGHRPPSARGSAPTYRRLHTRRWWTAAGVLVLAVPISASVGDWYERARLAALADIPGIVAPLDGPVGELWRTRASTHLLAEAAGRVIGLADRPEGGVDVVGLDRGSGRTVWRASLGQAGPGARTAAIGGRCVVPSRATVVCVASDPTAARLVVLDASTGALRSESPVAPTTSVAVLGPDLVLGQVDSDGRIRVRRTDASGSVTRWTFLSPAPPSGVERGSRDSSVRVAGDLVLVGAASTRWVLTRDGVVVHSWAAGPTAVVGQPTAVLAGARLVAEPASSPGSTQLTALTTGGAAPTFTLAGVPVGPLPDDGSLGDLVLVRAAADGALAAFDAGSGRARWTVQGALGAAVTVLDGRVIAVQDGEVRSIDGGTGRILWATPVGAQTSGVSVSDGRLVLVARAAPHGGTVITAYGLDDGRRRWNAVLPDRLDLVTLAGTLYGRSAQLLVALGEPRT